MTGSDDQLIAQVLGGLKDLTFAANLVWTDGKKDLKVGVKLEDMGMFNFGESNVSEWTGRSWR